MCFVFLCFYKNEKNITNKRKKNITYHLAHYRNGELCLGGKTNNYAQYGGFSFWDKQCGNGRGNGYFRGGDQFPNFKTICTIN